MTKKITIKQAIKQCMIAQLTGFFLILGDNGKLLILDQKGDFVSTVSKEGVIFTVIGTASDKLLLGTEKGSIHVYHLASLKFVAEIPYQMTLLSDGCLNRNREAFGGVQVQQAGNAQVHKNGPPVIDIQTTSNLRFLMLKYSDSSFVVIDRSIMTPEQAIMGYQYGHFEAVTGL